MVDSETTFTTTSPTNSVSEYFDEYAFEKHEAVIKELQELDLIQKKKKLFHCYIANQRGLTYDISEAGRFLCIKNCIDCDLSIAGDIQKVIIENCQNLTIELSSTRTITIFETINCHGILTKIFSDIPKVKVLACTDCKFYVLEDEEEIKEIISERSCKIELIQHGNTFSLPSLVAKPFIHKLSVKWFDETMHTELL